MEFDAPVFFEGQNLFVESGIPIRERDITKLKKLGIKTVATAGRLVNKPQEPLKEHTTLHIFYLKNEEARCFKEYTKLLRQTRVLFALVGKREPVPKKNLDDTINTIFRWTKKYPKEMTQIIHGIGNPEADPAAAALHTAIIAVVIGCQKKMLGHELLALATAAFFHDTGMLFIPKEIREKKGKLDTRELEVMKTHSTVSYTMVRELGYPLGIANAVLDHHERWDGRGYPRRVPGVRIHEQARIISVADTYTALINKKPYRDHYLGYDAVKQILHGVGHQFSPETVKLLLRGIGIHPLGTIVLLSNYSLGRVIGTREESTLRPKVEIIRGKYGEKITSPHELDLVVRKDLYIVKAVDPRELEAS
jgi:HD-GYP domain-containing protein (c-di-GMP phosphodiesterase class II)